MSENPARLNRRGFLAAAGLSTYSVMFLADESARAAVPERTPDEIRDAFRAVVPLDPALAARRFDGEPHMTLVDLECDVLVAGGGPAGVCAALAAARHGARVILVQDRSRLG